MSFLKKVSAAALSAAMALSLASCGKDAAWSINVDGKEIRSGLFIFKQTNALTDAYSHMTESDTDVLNITIDGKASRDWINDKAVESLREYAAVESKFDECGLSLDENEIKRVSNSADQWWGYIGADYEKIGVAKQTYYDILLNSQKRSKLFDYYYGKGGISEVSDAQVEEYMLENNVRIRFVKMPLKDGEGNLLKSAGKEEMKAKAEGYIERIKGGESFDTIKSEYEKYYSDLITEATGTEPDADTVYSGPADTIVIGKTSSYPSAKTAETAFGLNAGDCVLVEENEEYYILSRFDLFVGDEYFEENRDDAVHSMKDDEFEEEIKKWVQSQNVVVNQKAIKKYKLDKLVQE